MTIPEKILIAAQTLGEASFSAEDLIVRCWELFPDDFGLQGYSTKYPDSNRVLSKIMGGSSPLRSNGWMRKVASKRYRLTDTGRLQAGRLQSRNDADVGEPQQRLGDVTRASAATLKRLLASRSYAKFSHGEDALTFGDACELWNISPRSNASQLAARMAEVNTAIDTALKSSAEHVVLPGGTEATRSELETLSELSAELAVRFRVELDVIRGRADERRR